MSRQRFFFIVGLCTSISPAGAQPPEDPPAEERPQGAPAAIVPLATERIRVEPGTRLHRQPDARSSVVAVIDAEIELEILERREPWTRVRYGSWKGWIAVHGGGTDGRAPDRTAWRLAFAREILGPAAEGPDRLGPFALLTDVRNRKLVQFLAEIAGHLPPAYQDRYRLDPRAVTPETVTPETVVLFSREADYRAYEAEVRPPTDRGTLGHAAHGLAVLYVGRQGPDDVAAVMVHELTHVLNRRVFRTAPSPWLEEGMANDLAFCRIDASRRLELASLGGRNVVVEQHSYRPGGWLGVDRAIHLSGPLASFSLLRDRWRAGDKLPLEELSELLASDFFDPEDRQLRYDTSTFFLRYLLDGEDDLAPRFRAFLASLTTTAADPPPLTSILGRSWSELESGFAAWLVQQSVTREAPASQ